VAEEERDMNEAKGLTKRRGSILTADRARLPLEGTFDVRPGTSLGASARTARESRRR